MNEPEEAEAGGPCQIIIPIPYGEDVWLGWVEYEPSQERMIRLRIEDPARFVVETFVGAREALAQLRLEDDDE